MFRSFLKQVLSFCRVLYFVFSKKDIKIGRNVYLDSHSHLHGCNLLNDYVRLIDTDIGLYSYISPFTIMVNVNVGNYCSIGPGCKIGLGIHPIDKLSTSPYIFNDSLFKKRREADFDKVDIGHDVWIGANVSILGGVCIGTGSVIGAGAVVTKDVPPFSIAVGCPAVIIRKRFSDEKISNIINSEWWEEEPSVVKDRFRNEI